MAANSGAIGFSLSIPTWCEIAENVNTVGLASSPKAIAYIAICTNQTIGTYPIKIQQSNGNSGISLVYVFQP